MDLLMKHALDKDMRRAAATAAVVTGFALLTFAGAAIRIPLPFTPVPITLQTFFVLCSGAFLGGFAGSASQLLYILFGIAGFSVFTGSGAGALYLCGPTGGYLAGFVLASLVSGLAVSRAKSFAGMFFCFLLGSAIILACGTAWLAFVTGRPFNAALAAGAVPFIPGDSLKSFTAAAIFCRFKKLSR
jgi:biotin transport system substrate-specific component